MLPTLFFRCERVRTHLGRFSKGVVLAIPSTTGRAPSGAGAAVNGFMNRAGMTTGCGALVMAEVAEGVGFVAGSAETSAVVVTGLAAAGGSAGAGADCASGTVL